MSIKNIFLFNGSKTWIKESRGSSGFMKVRSLAKPKER
jgi:hypothetical protein